MIRDRLISLAPVIGLLLLAVLTWWLDARVRAPQTLPEEAKHDPEFYIEGYKAVRMNPDGTRRYELTGTRLTHYSDGSGSTLQSPSLRYHDYERAPLTVSSDTAQVEGDGTNVYFRGNVTVARPAFENSQSLGIATDYLHVVPDREVATTDQPVTLTEGSSSARSVGLEFDNKVGKIRLLSTVQAHYEHPRSRRSNSSRTE